MTIGTEAPATRTFYDPEVFSRDPKEAARQVKAAALEFGADAVGIGNIERWEGAPVQMDPRQIMPEARSVIALGFRVMRGSLRGIEEGTFFSNYSAMGYGGLAYLYIPMAVLNLSKFSRTEASKPSPWGIRATGAPWTTKVHFALSTADRWLQGGRHQT